MLLRARSLGIGDRCEFIGHIPPAELAEVMRLSDVLCLPSISEGWGNVITEAMACGTPVVGANVGGIPEQIISDEYGFLCDPYSPEDIAEKILLALDKTWDHKKIAERGRMHTRNDAAKKIADVYRRILNECAEYHPSLILTGLRPTRMSPAVQA